MCFCCRGEECRRLLRGDVSGRGWPRTRRVEGRERKWRDQGWGWLCFRRFMRSGSMAWEGKAVTDGGIEPCGR